MIAWEFKLSFFHYNFPVVESAAGNTFPHPFCFKSMAATVIVHPESIISSINNTGLFGIPLSTSKTPSRFFCLTVWVISSFFELDFVLFFIA